MRYLGGKKRQGRTIAETAQAVADFSVYVEPFCGGMWSAVAAIETFPSCRFILSDANPYLMRFWKEALAGWDPPQFVTEEQYNDYNKRRPKDDPLTGYIGFAMSFGGKFFGGWARDTRGKRVFDREASKASLRKIAALRSADVTLSCCDFSKLPIPDGSIVYLDPPYGSRTAQSDVTLFHRRTYYDWAENLSKRCTVIATEFENPRDWPVLHDFGDTVTRHHSSRGKDGTSELLLRVQCQK